MTLILFLVFIITFFLPDLRPVYSEEGEEWQLQDVNTEIPVSTMGLKSRSESFPYQYHDFDFCQSAETASSIGSYQDGLFGPRSPYLINFLENKDCTLLCKKSYSRTIKQKLEDLKNAIASDYEHRWFVDERPVKWCFMVIGHGLHCRNSFPVGCYVTPTKNTCRQILKSPKKYAYYLFNHVDLQFIYRSEDTEKGDAGANQGQIVLVKATPASIDHRLHPHRSSLSCDGYTTPLVLPSITYNGNFTISYTYSVSFYKNNTMKRPSRWD
ncbi:transmembrane 9 superfamily member 2-like [Ostrinia furnacalis]|uniref:transmembrane 9 superfamily member 2-like n=1 Tax=Ostrinia furnacalis TaxID=93504 RepID=UPI00103FA74A|nr:transmembrane 9 superfamily member 2-like [Ostrinia furnacalis]